MSTISRKQIKWIGGAILLALLCGYVVMYSQVISDRSYVKPFESGNGWGYCVYVNNELVIRQSMIPSIQGMNAFPTRKVARQTGLLVLQRVQKGLDPTITEEDLVKLKVVNPS